MRRDYIIAGLLAVAALGSLTAASVYRTRWLEREREAEALRVRLEEQAVKERRVSAQAPATVPVVATEDTARIAALTAQLAAQEEELAALRRATSVLVTAAAIAPIQPDRTGTNAPAERRSWLEDLQQTDPARYEEIMARREQARQEARYDIAKKAAFFLQQPVEGLSEVEQEEYVRIMELLTASLKLTEQLDAGLGGDERREVVRSLRDNMRELSPLLEAERGKEFFQVGKDLGYSDADAEAFAAYLTEVVDLTSVNKIFRNAMRGMGGWGGGGWGGEPPAGNRPP